MKSNIDIIKDYLNGDRPICVFGYTGDKGKYRKEGETWVDIDGIEWKREKGKNVKLTKSQGDIIREAIGDQKCKCGLNIKWGNKYDHAFFAKTGMCQDCLVDYETRLRAVGMYEVYEAYKILSNQLGFLKDARAKIRETIEYFTNNDGSIEILCNSEGFRERFHGTNKETILQNAKTDLKEANKLIKAVTTRKQAAKKELRKLARENKVKVYV